MEISDKKVERGKEEWRKSKFLGFKLGTKEDIQHRMCLACVSFNKFKKIWNAKKHIDMNTKLKIYDATVIPVFLYNSCTWASTKSDMEKLDRLHRKHLKQIMNLKWPKKIRNERLYHLANVGKVSDRVKLARWNMVRKVFAHSEQNPSLTALLFSKKAEKQYKGRRGRPKINLYDQIMRDLNNSGLRAETDEDMENVKEIAKDKKKWEELFLHSLQSS